MRKLLFVANQYFPNVVGGAEISVQTLVEELARRGHEVSVVSLSPNGRSTVDVVNGIRVHRLAVRNVYPPFEEQHHPLVRGLWHLGDVYNPLMARKLGELLDQERPDWVSVHNIAGFSVAVWSAIKSRGLGFNQVLHDYYAICPRTTMNKAGTNCDTPCGVCRVYGAPKKLASRLPDVVIGVSRFVLEKHLSLGYFPGVHSGVVYNGRTFQAPRERPERLPGAQLRIGYIGRVEQVKGIETLLRAVSRLPPDRWSLRVAGRAPDPQYFADLQQRFPLPQVEYLGYVSSAELYRTVDVVVIPSEWQEPLGSVVFEALGFGMPVIASRVGGIPEILEGADCGSLFARGDVDELTAQLSGLLDGWPDPQGVWERAIRRRQYFTPERMADDFLRVIQSRPVASSTG